MSVLNRKFPESLLVLLAAKENSLTVSYEYSKPCVVSLKTQSNIAKTDSQHEIGETELFSVVGKFLEESLSYSTGGFPHSINSKLQ